MNKKEISITEYIDMQIQSIKHDYEYRLEYIFERIERLEKIVETLQTKQEVKSWKRNS